MHQSLGPDDLHQGLPEDSYLHDAISENYLTSLMWSQGAALASHRAGRGRGQRLKRRVAYRCDVKRCLLLEVVDANEGTILFLPGYKVSRAEAIRRGCALRTYIPRAAWLDRFDTSHDSFDAYKEVGLECPHHVMGILLREVFVDLRAPQPVTRVLPCDPPGPGIPVWLYRDRLHGLDQESLARLANARTRFVRESE